MTTEQKREAVAILYDAIEQHGLVQTLHTVFGGHGSGQTAVVGLGAAQGQQHGAALILRILQQIFQLAQFIAANTQIGQVITLDVELHTQILRNAGKVFQRSGQMEKGNFFMSEQHKRGPPVNFV